ncbi:MAG: UDP-N-acetylglucosamine diphosphorylase [Clostridiales Family XIII bacterium]|jgi:bifunctional UDP-N-acetylglucosamine pyrophosphorylase/glucosamine-1-phosphate N-acetyltransferase|nr:UDP-N-acetylglucosamine diphosphorylase [Clostridiales Family XIII bacterium]
MAIFKSEIEQEYEAKTQRRRRLNLAFAEKGVVFFDLDQALVEEGVRIGAGTYIGPAAIITGRTAIGENCVIGQGCRIDNCEIADGVELDHSVLKDSKIGEKTTVGPFAYVRPGSVVGRRCRIGDFVEVKNSQIGDDTKVSHLSYIGDSELGAGVNVGCGVVFVNYDGAEKHRSTVGDGAFIGCNANIVSPVSIGAGSYIAAGGTVTRDVPPGALFVARDKGRNIEGWAGRRGLLGSRLEKQGGQE